ncbi:hypothetical protein [Streptomyces sp. NPDC056304]|uniref:hypothetical protein n=1 Tax=Streptomyces sp. NPDC056304 TaxID=3345778 RepID=UPI0035E0277F
MSDISRRALLGATGTAAAATLLTTTGTAQAAETEGGKHGYTPHATSKETEALMAGTRYTVKYEAYLDTDEDSITHATFDGSADPDDAWAFLDAAKARHQKRYPTLNATGRVIRYEQVTTEMPHP